jgi:peptidoglycan/LPS O-acetylase OafA/YrhL
MTNNNYSAQVIHSEYFPHIDGIRALAVLPVMLFHILPPLCPGGFTGVDVFFVISGYLITGGILRDLKNARFTIRNFYHRRIRRIMPAYFALIAGVFVAGCGFYHAAPLIGLGDAVAAGTLFVANYHFWRLEGDYFGPNMHTQALLHLWSLSVEEQFYLFIPLLCAIIWKFQRRFVSPALALLAVLSLAGSI